jgi:hypothetical protein
VWELIGEDKQLGLAYDQASTSFAFWPIDLLTHAQLVSQSVRFISAAIRSGAYHDIFEVLDTIRELITGVL